MAEAFVGDTLTGVRLRPGERLYGLAAAFFRLGVRGGVAAGSLKTWMEGGVTIGGDRLGVGEGRAVSAPGTLRVSTSTGERRLRSPWYVSTKDWREVEFR